MKDVEKVKVYHIEEYCEGASHFCFSERKDVVLLEDYEKLREENKRLKAENKDLKSKLRDNGDWICNGYEQQSAIDSNQSWGIF